MLAKLYKRIHDVKSLLCVGLDSEVTGSQFEFNKKIIDLTHPYVCAYKPNFAFYEAKGLAGVRDLKKTMEYLRKNHPDIFTIADAKRGDIGSTNKGYVASIFDDYGFDAVTLHPYLGKEALQPFLERKDKVSIILCHTSNPGAPEFQDAIIGGKPLWQLVAQHVAKDWNGNGNCMLVAGATYPNELRKIRKAVGEMPLLVPGVGTQGGKLRDVLVNGLGKESDRVIISLSRDIIFNQDPAEAAKAIQKEVQLWFDAKSN